MRPSRPLIKPGIFSRHLCSTSSIRACAGMLRRGGGPLRAITCYWSAASQAPSLDLYNVLWAHSSTGQLRTPQWAQSAPTPALGLLTGRGLCTHSARAAELAACQPLESDPTVVEFTPDQSALGGALIGLAASAKLGFTGRILGVSGIIGGLLRGDISPWRFAWLGGLASGSLALAALAPEAFPTLPDSYSLLRAASAGLLVGLGTSLGSGCTSGHGICGLSRLAARSLAATGTFMVSGAVVAAASGTLAVTGADVGVATSMVLMTAEQWRLGASLLGGSVAALGLLRALPSLGMPKQAVSYIAEAATGGIFALGLGLSGMLQPAKVAGFLSPLLPAWDPSLALVMGTALAVSLPAFSYIKRRSAPLCLAAFSLPTKAKIDRPLLLGSLMFGAGWGLGGVCPGPGIVSLAQPTPQLATLVAAMCLGMHLHGYLTPLYDRLLGGSTSILKAAEVAEPPPRPEPPAIN